MLWMWSKPPFPRKLRFAREKSRPFYGSYVFTRDRKRANLVLFRFVSLRYAKPTYTHGHTRTRTLTGTHACAHPLMPTHDTCKFHTWRKTNVTYILDM